MSAIPQYVPVLELLHFDVDMAVSESVYDPKRSQGL